MVDSEENDKFDQGVKGLKELSCFSRLIAACTT